MDLMAGALANADYASLNPNIKTPTLVDGDFVLWESSAIMAYLCIKHGSDMWPSHSPAEQVDVVRWLSWNDGHWAPAIAPFYFEHVVKSTFGMGSPDRESLKSSRPNFLKFAKVLDQHLEGHNYVACNRLTIVDFQLASMATDWRKAEMEFESFPNIVDWINRLDGIPAWADPWPRKAPVAA
jgi:glutathione S-transferase